MFPDFSERGIINNLKVTSTHVPSC